MPFYGDSDQAYVFLGRAIAGLYAQTDQDWRLVIIDDASPLSGGRHRLDRAVARSGGRIDVLFQDQNVGPGACRNAGIQHAAALGAPFILFNDADDVSHPRRLDVTRSVFADEPQTDFVYSTFIAVDEDDKTVPVRSQTPSVSELLEVHRTAPVHGADAWIRIGTETAYTTLTSTVAVRTELAVAQPFAEFRGSEDTHTWFRMTAAGHEIAYIPSIASLYRVRRDRSGSADRARLGDAYYRNKATCDDDGFQAAMDIALSRSRISQEQVPALRAKFYRRLAETLAARCDHR
jgi:hypothetical protein